MLVVSGTFIDTAGNTYDAAFDYTSIPATGVTNRWTLDGDNSLRPTPDSYNPAHVYNYPFVGNGAHQFEFLNFGLIYSGVLNFEIHYISVDTSLYNYAWSTNPASVPFIISTADTVLANM